MNTFTLPRAVALAATVSFAALVSAAPATAGNSSAANSTGSNSMTTQDQPAPAKRDAKSVLHDRMTKCKPMHGDEKRACEKDAHADAAAMSGRARSSHDTAKSH